MVVFGVLLVAVIVVGLGALAMYLGVIESPFGREFSQPRADATTTPPCLPRAGGDDPLNDSEPYPIPYSEIDLRILNASNVAGLAHANATILERRGFEISEIGDFPGRLRYTELRFGERGIIAAYTVAAQFSSIRLVLDDREVETVDLVLGGVYEEPLAEDVVNLFPNVPMTNADDCLPANRLIPLPGPSLTVLPSPEATN